MKDPIVLVPRPPRVRPSYDGAHMIALRNDLHSAVKAISTETRIPMTELFAMAVKQFLERVQVQKDEAKRIDAIPNGRKA